ncbi:hypothetical protein I4U23_027168 [Adineta vaga]|nr:hypothetical protein I4U23_027168 [Adineta vaga]
MKIILIFLIVLHSFTTNTATEEKSTESTTGETLQQLNTHKKIISIPNVPKPTSPYNSAIQFGQILYLAGQLGVNLTTRQLISDDVQNQTEQAMRNIETLLYIAGSNLTELLQCRVFLIDINDYQIMNQIYASFFSLAEYYPVRTTVAVTALAMNAKVEIECTAFITQLTNNFIMSSIAMLIALPMGVGSYIHALNYDNPYTTNIAFCKLRTYILQSSTMIYRWCITVACIDRCISTSTNVRLRNFASVRIAYRVIPSIVIVWLILPIQALVLFNLRNNRCGILYNVGLSLYFSSYTIITGSIFPTSIMIICAMLIHRNLRVKRHQRRQIIMNHHEEKDRRLVIDLIDDSSELKIDVYRNACFRLEKYELNLDDLTTVGAENTNMDMGDHHNVFSLFPDEKPNLIKDFMDQVSQFV